MRATAVEARAVERLASAWSKTWKAFTRPSPIEASELMVSWVALAVICALAFIPHIIHGGFYLDDWSNAAGTFHPPGGPGLDHALSLFAEIGLYRPVLVVYTPLTYSVFGMHMSYHLAWAAILALMAAAMFYGVLRMLGVPPVHAWVIAALTIVYPWSDSTRFWETASQISLSATLAFAGLWIALAGIQRRSVRWHACAAVFYLVSILTYEIALPLIALAGVLYTIRAGWRTARARWAVDLTVVVAGGLWVGTHTARTTSGLSGDISHLKEIATGAETIIGRTLLPVGAQRTGLAMGILIVVLAVGLAVCRFGSRGFRTGDGWALREWLLLAGGGLALATLGWIMFIPADPYYTPSIYGMTNRVNGLAAFGLVTLAYGLFGVAGVLLGKLCPRTSVIAVSVTLILGASLGIGYVDVIRRHTGIWNSAFAAEMTGLDKIQARFPGLPHGTTLFVGGYSANQTLGVPIFSTTWDLDGMIKTRYEDGTLQAYPVLPGWHLACHARGIRLEGSDTPSGIAPYGTARLINPQTNLRSDPRDLKQCRAAVGNYGPGPLYLSTDY